MPKLNMESPHALGRDEALRRLKAKVTEAEDAYGSQVNDLQNEWNDQTLSFGFKTMGMSVAGTVAVEDGVVKLSAKLPMAAMMFKGMIEERIRSELGELLA